MKLKAIELTLPEWTFLDANSHEGNSLENRTIIYHVRTSTVIEILDRYDCSLNPNAITLDFNGVTLDEPLVAVVHYSTTLDFINNKFELEELLQKTAIWYRQYSAWENNNILNSK